MEDVYQHFLEIFRRRKRDKHRFALKEKKMVKKMKAIKKVSRNVAIHYVENLCAVVLGL